MQRLVEQHAAILSVKARDALAAEEAVRIHLSEGLASLPVLGRQFPDLFESGAAAASEDALQHAEHAGA